MAASKPKAAYATDQRNLSVALWANSKGGTDYSVTWRHCLAGEETLREVTLVKGHWPATLNEWEQTDRALLWLANALHGLVVASRA